MFFFFFFFWSFQVGSPRETLPRSEARGRPLCERPWVGWIHPTAAGDQNTKRCCTRPKRWTLDVVPILEYWDSCLWLFLCHFFWKRKRKMSKHRLVFMDRTLGCWNFPCRLMNLQLWKVYAKSLQRRSPWNQACELCCLLAAACWMNRKVFCNKCMREKSVL